MTVTDLIITFKSDFKHIKMIQIKINIENMMRLNLNTDDKEIDMTTANVCVEALNQHVNSDVDIDLIFTDLIFILKLYQIMTDIRKNRERTKCSKNVDDD